MPGGASCGTRAEEVDARQSRRAAARQPRAPGGGSRMKILVLAALQEDERARDPPGDKHCVEGNSAPPAFPQRSASRRQSSLSPYGQEQFGNRKLPTFVDQLKDPVLLRYSVVT